MTEPCLGEMFDFPRVTLTLSAGGAERDVEFIVDTGFDGDLALPIAFASYLGPATSSIAVVFADGREEDRGIVECSVEWFGALVPATVMFIDGVNPLIGL